MNDKEPDECGIQLARFRGWTQAACEFHDKAYIKGSWHQQNMSRKEVDKHFLSQLLLMSKNSVLKKAASYFMYSVTRLGGWMFWEGKR